MSPSQSKKYEYESEPPKPQIPEAVKEDVKRLLEEIEHYERKGIFRTAQHLILARLEKQYGPLKKE